MVRNMTAKELASTFAPAILSLLFTITTYFSYTQNPECSQSVNAGQCWDFRPLLIPVFSFLTVVLGVSSVYRYWLQTNKRENNGGGQKISSEENWIGPDGTESGPGVPEDWYLTYNGPAPIVEGIYDENYGVDRGNGAVPIDYYIKKWGVPEGFGKTDHEKLWSKA